MHVLMACIPSHMFAHVQMCIATCSELESCAPSIVKANVEAPCDHARHIGVTLQKALPHLCDKEAPRGRPSAWARHSCPRDYVYRYSATAHVGAFEVRAHDLAHALLQLCIVVVRLARSFEQGLVVRRGMACDVCGVREGLVPVRH